jgi:YidC/Oxa1 family membrane protein insertase
MFTTLIVQPIFNLLVFIYGVLPGHNLGLAIILFTIIIRLLMWPLIKKQLHQVKVMRQIQPELKKIKAAAKGNRRQESLMMMELYKERGVNPFGSIGVLLLQLPILIGLYLGLQRVIKDPSQIEQFAYPFLQHLPWIQYIADHIKEFDITLFSVVDLTRSALGPNGIYWPAMMIVIGSAVAQFYQSKQLAPSSKDARSLRAILKESSKGKQADQSEISAATARSTRYLLPALILIFTINIPSALALYWLTSGVVALIQQSIILREDTTEMEAKAGKTTVTSTSRADNAIEAEVVETKSTPKAKKSASRSKRRK